MTCLNYQIPRRKSQELAKIAFIIVTILFGALLSVPAAASDKCKDIANLDDRNACYEKEKQEQQKDYESTSKKLEDIRRQKDAVNAKVAQLSSQLGVTQAQIDDLEDSIKEMEKQLDIINKNLADRKGTLAEKVALRNNAIRNYAKRAKLNELELFLSGLQFGSFTISGFQYSALAYIFDKSVTDDTIKLIKTLNSEIDSYEKDKAEGLALKNDLENSKSKLVALKNQVESQKTNAQSNLKDLAGKEKNTADELKSIQEKIDELNAKQQAILNEKNGAGSSSVGDYEAPSYELPNPGFSPAFVAFSYGAYTHGNGMSQYGAKGRAEDGQSYKDILKFYYKVGVKTDGSFPSKISVKGYGEMDFQKYLYGIAEMPSSWDADALKAQAIAARTYASKASKPICTSESCQVFLKSKSDNPPSSWKKAVDDTKNMVLDGASTSQYSSTTGGYINNVGWDTKGGSWPQQAYEKRAGSPWFYKAWFTKSYANNSDKCGRSNPWLKESEMADILNAMVVWEKGTSSDRNHISPTTTSCWGGDPYSTSEMASRADDLGTKYTSVSGVDTTVGNNGTTTKVVFQTNAGSVSIDGAKFKTVFNLRAPGYISIKNKLFDMVKK